MKILKKLKRSIFKRLFRSLIFKNYYNKANTFCLTIDFKIKELQLKETDKCLLLAPHADDESIGCCGLLLRYPKNFTVICLSDGRYSDKFKPIDKLIEERKLEFDCVMNELGIKSYIMLGIEDRNLINNFKTFSKIDISNYRFS